MVLCHCLREVTWSEHCCTRSFRTLAELLQQILQWMLPANHTGNSWFCPGKPQNDYFVQQFSIFLNLHSRSLQNGYCGLSSNSSRLTQVSVDHSSFSKAIFLLSFMKFHKLLQASVDFFYVGKFRFFFYQPGQKCFRNCNSVLIFQHVTG